MKTQIQLKPSSLLRRSAVAGILILAALIFFSGCTSPALTTLPAQTSTTTTVQSPAETSTATSEARPFIQLISPADARDMLANDPAVVLLDVRTEAEYAAGHIADSQLLPYDEIEARINELPGDLNTPIIVICRSGRRSAIAAETLAALGYSKIYDLGGIIDWPYEIVTE